MVIMPPVYGPFRQSVEATGRRVMAAPLRRRADGGFDMDLDAVEKQLQAGAKACMLCNPHNPVSRLWRREGLTALLEVIKRYGAALISDEIHADFCYAPEVFTPILSLASERVVSLCAASKTFNLAGLQQAACLCRDGALRERIRKEIDACGVRCGNLFALEATRAAYNEGDAWLDGLLAYLSGSRKVLSDLVSAHLPRAVLTPIEATYLAWLDLRAYGFSEAELLRRTEKAGVYFTAGTFFGLSEGEGFLRVNFACPRRYLEEGILRLRVALEE